MESYVICQIHVIGFPLFVFDKEDIFLRLPFCFRAQQEHSEKTSILKGKDLFLRGENSFLFEKIPLQKRVKQFTELALLNVYEF